MTEARHANPAGGAGGDDGGDAAASGMAEWLCLAAAPTFAIMSLMAGVFGPTDVFCSGEHGSPLGGMVPMYGLMSLFHLPPWLRFAFGRRWART